MTDESGVRREAGPELSTVMGGAPVFSLRQIRRVRDLLARLTGARRAVTFYPVGHPAVAEAAEGMYSVLNEFFASDVDVPLTFFENEVILGNQVLTEESMIFDQLVRDMSASGANGITFRRGLSLAELQSVLPILAADAGGIAEMGGLEAALARTAAQNVSITTVRAYEPEIDEEMLKGLEAARESYGEALDLIRDLDRLIRTNRLASGERVKGVVRSMVDNVLTNRFALLELSGLKDFDEYTFFHSVNVAILALALGSTVSCDRRFLNSLGVGALMHDIGKLTVDAQVLNKAGSLSSDEWETVRLHPQYGAEAAATMPGLDRASIVVILEHHMRYDMDGYPVRKPRRGQHLASRIVAVADAYDAMTSRRSYSAARLQDQAMEVLAKNAGTAFDPALVRLFLQLMGVYPPRSVVRLTTGEVGVVVRPGESDALRPVVRVFAEADGGLIDPVEIDLAVPDDAEGRTIVACLDPAGINVDVDDYL